MMFRFFRRNRFSRPVSTEKTFPADFDRFTAMLESSENFALSRFGDGEMKVVSGVPIDLSRKCNGEHQYIPGDPVHERQRERLTQALRHQSGHYFVGIGCPCCVGEEAFLHIKRQSGQPEAQLTWANLFVNSNFPRFQSVTIPLLRRRKVVIICHRLANPDGLPFPVAGRFAVGPNAWLRDYDSSLNDLTRFIDQNHVKDHVFLFCAGVLSNLLIHELFRRLPGNAYLDVGSVFDVELGLGTTRKYLRKSRRRLNKVCVWI